MDEPSTVEGFLDEIIDLSYQGALDPVRAPKILRVIRTKAFLARSLYE